MRSDGTVKRVCVPPGTAIRAAIECLDHSGVGIVLVTDEDNRLVGTVTDGDIRRAMLVDVDLDQPVEVLLRRKEAHYRKPWTAAVGTAREDLFGLMREQVIRHVPLLDAAGRVADLVTLDDLVADADPQPVEALIWPADHNASDDTANHWKHALLPVGNRSLLEMVVDQLRKSGIRRVSLAATATNSTTVESVLGDGQQLGVSIRYVDRGETVGASPPATEPDAPLIVLSANVLARVDFRSLLQFHREHAADVTVAVRRQAADRGDLVEIDGASVTGLPDGRRVQFTDAGIYVLGPKARAFLRQEPGLGMRDVMRHVLAAGGTIASFPLREYWITIGTLEDYHRLLADEKRGLLSDAARLEPGTPAPAGVVPLCVPEIRGSEWAYVKECLDTNWVSSVGPFVDTFETMLATYVGVRHAVATCNGTSALHVALLVAGVRPADEVLVSALTFIAPANAIRYAGAIPVFVDAEPDYWQMDTVRAAEMLRRAYRRTDDGAINRDTGRRLGAIVPVHILGHPCDMAPLVEAAHELGVPVIEDATESLGATYRGRPVGTLADAACFSFNGNKLITTGGGGMYVTDNETWARRARYLTTQAKDDPIEFVHGAVGFNYRLTNIQAAMGCAQLEQVDAYLQAKRDIAARYRAALSDVPGITPMPEADWARHAWWLYTVRVNAAQFGVDSRTLLRHLQEQGVQTRPLWQPLHRSPAHRDAAALVACPMADAIHAEALSLPCSVGLTDVEFGRVVAAIREVRE